MREKEEQMRKKIQKNAKLETIKKITKLKSEQNVKK